jgi:predicted  nucleic acid-binding Zn-ribbon protein
VIDGEVRDVVMASPQDQWRLLDVQAHDTKLRQLAHRRGTLPEIEQVALLRERASRIGDEIVAARIESTDVARELAKAEADVEQVRQRAARNQSRLDAGQGSAKDLQAMQHELITLSERQAVLEEAELDVMERAETAQQRIGELEAERVRLSEELSELEAVLASRYADIDAEVDAEERARTSISEGLPGDLIALYEKIREQAGGIGAARLARRRCEGCRLELNTTDLNRFREAAENEVLRCEECRRILIRTAESGL